MATSSEFIGEPVSLKFAPKIPKISRRSFCELCILTGLGVTLMTERLYKITQRLNISFTEAMWVYYQQYKDVLVIEKSIISRIQWYEMVQKYQISPQKYDLSCEIKALQILGMLNGYMLGTEDEIISQLQQNKNPNLGVHPELTEVLNSTQNSRWGQLPPQPYGIFAKPLWQMASENMPIHYHNNNEGSKNNGFNGNKSAYNTTLTGLVASDIPVIAWTHRNENYGQFSEESLPPMEHAVIVIGAGKSSYLTIDPLNLEVYRETKKEFTERAKDVGFNLLWMES